MIRDILSISLLLLLLSCPSLSREVVQDPSSILGSPDTPATISCSHSTSSYDMILWYRQPTGHSHLNLIGYVYATSQSIEDAFKGHFEVSGDGSVESELHVLKLRQPEDSGMYFCAARRHEPSENSVHQNPTALIKHLGEDVLMTCSHSSARFDQVQWYKQSAGGNDMVLLGYVRFTNPTVEAQFKGTYNVSGNGQSLAHLHIPKTRRSEDSAVYFCAASEAQRCTNPASSTKTPCKAAGYTMWNHHMDKEYAT
ncbi:hypothetical protein KUCAC02_026547 [Chaenocephalus aceratus]|nr:hypothetical protein KUCAC02_026547 [Chaenocephalus aceratus]